MRAACHRCVVEARHYQCVRAGWLGQFDNAVNFGRTVATGGAERIAVAGAHGVGHVFRTDAEDDVTAYPFCYCIGVAVQRQGQQRLVAAVVEFECRGGAVGGELAAQEFIDGEPMKPATNRLLGES